MISHFLNGMFLSNNNKFNKLKKADKLKKTLR